MTMRKMRYRNTSNMNISYMSRMTRHSTVRIEHARGYTTKNKGESKQEMKKDTTETEDAERRRQSEAYGGYSKTRIITTTSNTTHKIVLLFIFTYYGKKRSYRRGCYTRRSSTTNPQIRLGNITHCTTCNCRCISYRKRCYQSNYQRSYFLIILSSWLQT